MKIGSTYLRIAPNGDKSFVTVDTQEEKEYYESYEKEGYIYQEQSVTSIPSAWVCTSCEG